jgi:hypothetical protein
MPLPQKEQTEGWPIIALQLKPVSIMQLFEHPGLFPLSHCSPWSRILSPHIGTFRQKDVVPI